MNHRFFLVVATYLVLVSLVIVGSVQALAVEIRFVGTVVEQFRGPGMPGGAGGWYVRVENVISGPSMEGRVVLVWSRAVWPSGQFGEVKVGDTVEVFGSYSSAHDFASVQGDTVSLVGSESYYCVRTTAQALTTTVTVTVWVTSTRTETQLAETTATYTTTTTVFRTIEDTRLGTVTANQVTVTQTLTGMTTSTVYSPTVTVIVNASAQITSNLLWLALSTFAMVGSVFHFPRIGRMRTFYRKLANIFSISEALAWLTKRQVRRALFTTCLIVVVVLSIASQAGQMAYGSTVTTTRTVTNTQWTTVTQRITTARYTTSTATETSTLTRTNTGFTTVTPTVTTTVDQRLTTTVYSTSTVYSTTTHTTSSHGISVTVELDESFEGGFYPYYISSLRADTGDSQTPHVYSFTFSSSFCGRGKLWVDIPDDACPQTIKTGELLPTSPELQPITFDVLVCNEDSCLGSFKFKLDLSHFTESHLTIVLSKADNTIRVSEVTPAIKVVAERGGFEIVGPVGMHESMWNRLPLLSRTFYYTVTVRNRSPSHSIALMGIGVDLPKGYNWKLSGLKVDAPRHEGEVVKAWEALGAISTAQGLAEAYGLAGVEGIIYTVLTDGVQDFTHTSDYESVDLLMADPVVSYGGKQATMLLIPGDQATFEFAIREDGWRTGTRMTPVFKAQYIEVQQTISFPEWRPLENWVNFLIAFDWKEVNELLTISSETTTVPAIPP